MAVNLVCLAGVAAASLAFARAAQQQPPRFADRVSVDRVVVDVHVLEDDGRPVTGLSIEDFRVLVDGRPVAVESVRWTTESVALRLAGEAAGTSRGAASELEELGVQPGRQIVLLFQKDMEPTRLEGLMRMLRQALAFVDGLDPDDRVAVASFASHLELWTDFTRDREILRLAIEGSILFASRAEESPVEDLPSLALYFDRQAGRDAASMEESLAVLGQALDRVPGAKTLILFGHGFGRSTGVGFGPGIGVAVSVEDEYAEARRLLLAGRVTVFCLDVTRAAAHSLEAGLRRVASDTGGFYLSTDEFPSQAMARVARAITGHYELSFEKPALPPGEHRMAIELKNRRGRVFARPSYIG